MADRVPVLVVSGYLGAGKTTLVGRLMRLAKAEGVRLAVVSNEFGDTGIDRALLDAGDVGFVELDGGCICCRLSDALGEILEALISKTKPDRLLIECSGVALPGEVVVQLWRPPLEELVGDVVIAVLVDADRVARQPSLLADDTFLEQVSAADLLVLNKADLVDAGQLERARERLDELSGGRPVVVARHGDVDPTMLFAVQAGARTSDDHEHDHAVFVSRQLRFDGVVDAAVVAAQIRRSEVLRAKGFLRTVDGVVLLQGVGDRVEVTPHARPVPEELVGTIVVVDRADRG